MTEDARTWHAIGGRVRQARTASGLTVRELARRIGVSASHVSQVERGIGTFSVPALYAVARELDVSMHELLEPAVRAESAQVVDEAEPVEDLEASGVVQRASAHPMIRLSAGPTWSRLTAGPEPDVEFLEVRYPPGMHAAERVTTHEGREFGVLVDGRLEVEVDGARATLAPGDSIVFDSSRPHRFWNDGEAEARAIWFVRDSR